MSKRTVPRVHRKLFCINSMPRCGTHLLRTSLNKHPDIYCFSEVFNSSSEDVRPFAELDVAQAVKKMAARPGKRVGFCVHRNRNVRYIETEKHKCAAARIPGDIPTIVLYRENMLAQYVSFRRSLLTHKWQVYKGETPPDYPEVELNAADMRRFFHHTLKTRFPPLYRYSSVMVMTYEELTSDFDRAIKRVLRFLKLPLANLSPGTVKTGVPLEQAVSNYQAIKSEFSETRWAKFFQAPT